MLVCEHCAQDHDPATRFCPQTGKLIATRLLPPGSLLEGKYNIGRTLGVGGMGAVFEATHKILGHKVAVKVLLPELSREPTMASRLIREGRAASATGHPNIAMVTDMGTTADGALFVVMEYLEGCTLDDIIDGAGPLTIPRASSLVVQLLNGLEAVHQASIIHRDLKPENIMVVHRDEQEVVKILDFGISKMIDEETKQELTSTGLVIGTPAFMSPEQSKGAADVDHRADLYSVGAIYYKLLTGQPPVTAPGLAQLLARLLQGEIDPPSKKRPEVPAALDRVVMRALALKADDRFPDARSFRSAVEPFCKEAVFVGPLPATSPALPASPAPTPSFEVDERFGELSDDALVALDEVGAPAAPSARPGSRAAAPPLPPTIPATAAPLASPPVPAPEPAEPPIAEAVDPFSDAAFRPPEEEEILELDTGKGAITTGTPASWPPGADDSIEDRVGTPQSVVRSVPTARSSARKESDGSRTRLYLIALGAVAVVALLYFLLAGDDELPPPPPEVEAVSIALETEPSEVDLFVDGVQQVDLPIRLPRSTRPFSIRVQAKGYMAKTIQVVPSRSQRLKITLRPIQQR